MICQRINEIAWTDCFISSILSQSKTLQTFFTDDDLGPGKDVPKVRVLYLQEDCDSE